RRPLPPEPEPRGGGGASWLIALLFLVLAGAVTYGGFLVFGPPKHDIKPPVTTASVQAPNLIGLTKAQAEDLLKQRGLQGKEGPIEANNDIPKEQVCRQDPAPDATISKDTPVLYWISKGPSSFTMPDVSTMTLDRAKKEIRDAGFQADFKITSENSDQPKQTIIRQDPASGALVDCAKGKVTLVASKGTEVQAVVQETWNPGSAPDLGKDSVYVRIELERPAHSEPKEIYHGTLSPGDKIPVQHFERFANEQVLVRVLAGDDEYSNLTTQTEVLIPSTAPGANAKPAMPGQ
ncbi:MAG TPA: PASTA domain-containing protein, partial [Armatimonadota bacterium]